MKVNSLYIFISSFVLGVAMASFFEIPILFIVFLSFLAVIFFALYAQRKEKLIFVIALILCALALGMFRFTLDRLEQESNILDYVPGEEVEISGVVVEEVDEREKNTRLTVRVDSLEGSEISGVIKILAVIDRYPEFGYGDEVILRGVLKKPENFENENGKIFDYISYLAKDDVRYLTYYPDVSLLSVGNGNIVKLSLFKVKKLFLNKIGELLPDPHVSLLGGLVVGAEQSLGEELKDDFRKTGIIHIVVLSGYNVTIVAEAIMRLFSFLPYMVGISFGVVTIVLFALLTGASATIVRASIMAILVLVARATGRTYQVLHALFIAGFFMVLHNPNVVLFDPSFQLSFMATIGLIYVAPNIEKYFSLLPTKYQLREFAVATIATQIFVLPLLLFMMGEMSLVALPVNLLVLMFIPITMLFGFLTGVIGLVSSFLALPFAFVTYGLLAYELNVVQVFAALPFVSVSIPYFPAWLMFSFYIFYGYMLFKWFKR